MLTVALTNPVLKPGIELKLVVGAEAAVSW